MRTTKSANGLSLKAYAGTTGVLLAFNVTEAKRTGLLGFALERLHPVTKKWEWMSGMMPFPGQAHDAGQPIPTDVAPIQKFRWSDYRVHAESTYSYRVHAMYGSSTKPRLLAGPMVTVTTASADEDGAHNVLFNRAAGASQAFSRDFPKAVAFIEDKRKHGGFATLTVDELDAADPGCKAWLTRGVLPAILDHLAQAKDASWALDIAIYEYEWHEIVDAVNAAAKRGVNVRLLYHWKKGDAQTDDNEASAAPLIKSKQAKPRATSAIFHDKFIVLSKVKKSAAGLSRTPVTVLCGSTNFTENGLFRQANVLHLVRTPKTATGNPTADSYLRTFETLWNGDGNAALPPADTKKWISANNPMDEANPLFAGFSPRAGEVDLDLFVKLINAAKSDVIFSTAFVLPPRIIDALIGTAGDPILRLGVQNKDANKIAGVHRDRTAQFAATALLDHGIEGWLKPETRPGGKGDILIHTKVVVIDFTTAHPVVISGSHNLSVPASGKNDENFLVISGNTDLADSYGVEVMRIYDHYRARWVAAQMAAGKFAGGGQLAPDDWWTNRYFQKDSLHFRDRLRFVGA